jgi:acyl carrier protein
MGAMRRIGFLQVLCACLLGCDQRPSTDDKDQANLKVRPQQQDAEMVEDIVRSVVSDRLRVKPQTLDMNKAIPDELDVVHIVMTLEERFVVEIPDQVIEKLVGAKLGDPKCKPSPALLVQIVRESRELANKK